MQRKSVFTRVKDLQENCKGNVCNPTIWKQSVTRPIKQNNGATSSFTAFTSIPAYLRRKIVIITASNTCTYQNKPTKIKLMAITIVSFCACEAVITFDLKSCHSCLVIDKESRELITFVFLANCLLATFPEPLVQ